MKGHLYVTKGQTKSIRAVELPQILSPCLQRFPVEQRGSPTVEAPEAQTPERHVEMLANDRVVETIRTRSKIIAIIRHYFEEDEFVEVETPILSALAGGANARPFETWATEFPDRKLSLRIAPELWLKRLIIGGMDRVFEIGPCFRNEGLLHQTFYVVSVTRLTKFAAMHRA